MSYNVNIVWKSISSADPIAPPAAAPPDVGVTVGAVGTAEAYPRRACVTPSDLMAAVQATVLYAKMFTNSFFNGESILLTKGKGY